jgi:succinyl-diaminopimelate desuccinylase
MDSGITDLLKQLIESAPTVQNGELNAAKVLHGFFLNHNIASWIDTWDKNRANVIAQIGPNTADTPTLVIGSHIDVVPAGPENWHTNPFEAVEKDGCIIGRGSVDMLGGICASAAAMADLQKSGKTLKGRILFTATAGEETDSCGVKRFVQAHADSVKNPIGILIPEPSGLRILRAHRGILWLKITAFGRTAHGSMPHLGINAIEKANVLLNRLKNWQIPHTPHDLLGGCSMSINRICGGSATNIVPDTCSIELDLRTLPDQRAQDIISDIEKLIAEIAHTDPEFKTEISILRSCPAMETKKDDPFLQKVCRASGIHETFSVGFTTDGPLFARLGAPVLIFGPGDGTRCHQPNETLEIAQLEKARSIYFDIMQSLLIN